MGLVNKQQSDTLYLFSLNQHLKDKLHLSPQRCDMVFKREDVCFLQEANVLTHNHFESCQFFHPHYL